MKTGGWVKTCQNCIKYMISGWMNGLRVKQWTIVVNVIHRDRLAVVVVGNRSNATGCPRVIVSTLIAYIFGTLFNDSGNISRVNSKIFWQVLHRIPIVLCFELQQISYHIYYTNALIFIVNVGFCLGAHKPFLREPCTNGFGLNSWNNASTLAYYMSDKIIHLDD